jgi:hypothetical protein
MSVTLKAFLSGLATDCQKFAQFVSDPATAIQEAGLSAVGQSNYPAAGFPFPWATH